MVQHLSSPCIGFCASVRDGKDSASAQTSEFSRQLAVAFVACEARERIAGCFVSYVNSKIIAKLQHTGIRHFSDELLINLAGSTASSVF